MALPGLLPVVLPLLLRRCSAATATRSAQWFTPSSLWSTRSYYQVSSLNRAMDQFAAAIVDEDEGGEPDDY